FKKERCRFPAVFTNWTAGKTAAGRKLFRFFFDKAAGMWDTSRRGNHITQGSAPLEESGSKPWIN
ncbi:hypothetical protein, partial [uncultured Oscillibacter sp.]|uniref:hypothetical protein n=1 Tax=uncultured Oscillibacter sp. TaxID=876091 RepID=UPI002729E102